MQPQWQSTNNNTYAYAANTISQNIKIIKCLLKDNQHKPRTHMLQEQTTFEDRMDKNRRAMSTEFNAYLPEGVTTQSIAPRMHILGSKIYSEQCGNRQRNHRYIGLSNSARK